MLKIGILTYHNTTNYGALLQAFALQSKINELGGNAEIINYHCKNIEKRELVTFPKLDKNIVNYLRNVRNYYKVSKKRKIISKFTNKYVSISKEEYNKDNINESNKVYDKFVVGSDMVFELGINGGDMTYYLDFAEPQKRYSYAASLGVDKIDDKYKNACIYELEQFQHISIREEQGKKYFSKLLKNKVYQDVDPTLLYDGSFWEKYEEEPIQKPKNGYILLYFLNKNMPELDVARIIAKEKNLDIIMLSNVKQKVAGCKVIHNASVGEFLYYIHNASLVITASFHGMIFSMNYNTSFMYFTNSKSSSRLQNIAEITGSTSRELTKNRIPDFNCDFSNINKSISIVRNKSIEYLKSIVNDSDSDLKNNVSVIKKSECCGCSACKAICPKKAIAMEPDCEGFLYPKINNNCINCGLCLKVCKGKKEFIKERDNIKVYAAKHKKNDVLKKSSSGGISRALCEYFIKNKGVVYGVVYNDKYEVIVEREETLNETDKLYGSKYVWANPKDTFEQVYNDLINGKLVLFIATSCFVAGLKSFLKMKRCNCDNLFTVDLICHGTPSPALFNDYINYLENKYDFDHFEFRTKYYPWGYGSKNYGCTIYRKNGKKIVDSIDSRLYLQLFFSNYALRPHCHNCEFANINKPSEITIADYWGLKDEHPDFFDEKGVSAIIVHNEKGQKIINQLDNVILFESSIEKVAKKQANLFHPSPVKEDRGDFWKLYQEKGFKSICKKYTNLNTKRKIKLYLRNILVKLKIKKG